MDEFVFALTLVATLGSGVVGGVLFAFSTFVMPALARLPSSQGVAAMQSINVVAVTPPFMAAFGGTALVAVAAAIASAVDWDTPSTIYTVLGSVLYLAGAFLLTGVYHVPRNDALAAVDPTGPGTADRWARYVAEWTTGNHVRTAASLGALVLYAAALAVD